MPGGRPRTPLGTYGAIKVSDTGPPYEASTYFRDADGSLRRVRRYASTKTKARDALKIALAERRPITADSTVAELGEEWLRRVDASNKAVGTKQQYRRTLHANVIPAIGKLRVSEVRVSTTDKALRTINQQHGYSVAKQARAVMSGMFGLAVRQDALAANPVRDAEQLSRTTPPKRPRALTVAEVEALTDWLRTVPRAVELDLPDLADWMLFTGCRIGEALALDADAHNEDGDPILDLSIGTWEINATVVRIKGQGLVVQEQPKSASGHRTVALPPAAVALASRRLGEARLRTRDVTFLDSTGRTGVLAARVVFASPFARTLRDPTNCAGDLREVLAGTDWAWITSHAFRKTVATRMEEAGCTPRQVADQLGHSKVSMTQDVYFGREVVASAAAKILDR